MNEKQLIIDANIEKAKLKRVSDAVSRIQMKKLVARRSIEDILAVKQLEAGLGLSCWIHIWCSKELASLLNDKATWLVAFLLGVILTLILSKSRPYQGGIS